MNDGDDALTVPTRVARAGWREHFHYGHRVFAELAGDASYTELIALAVTGRRPSKEAAAVLDDMAAAMTIAEPRIWPMKVSRLVSSYGRTVPAALAGALCFESELIGPWTTAQTARQLEALSEAVGEDLDDATVAREAKAMLAARGKLVGFGVPFRPADERVAALSACVERRGRADRRYWRLSRALWAALRESKGLEPNISSALAAAGLDLGLSPDELAPLTVALLHHIFWANAVEGAAQRPAVLRRLPDARVDYVGAPPRRSPRATGED